MTDLLKLDTWMLTLVDCTGFQMGNALWITSIVAF